VSTYTYIGIKGYESSEKEKLTLRSQPQPKLIVRLVISKIGRKLIVVSILFLLVVRSCSIRKWELRNPSNIGCEEKFRSLERSPWDVTTIEVVEEAVVVEDVDAEGSSTSCRATKHLKLSSTHMEVENKARPSPMPL
jgi:hypothetical protein